MNVAYQDSILYNDCELIFEAADETGRRYIAVHTGDYETGCEYLIAPASPESLIAFKNGKIDLLHLLLDSPTQEWYTAALDVNDDDVAIALKQKDNPISGRNDLPGAGFYIGVGNSRDMVQEDVPSTAPANTATPNAAAPRLIEKWLPINEVSIEAIREGGALAGHPPVNQLHVWWARRPLIASRAAIAASMLPTDADRGRFLANIGTSTSVVTARRQMDAVKAEGGWSDISFPNQRAFTHNPDFLTDNAETVPLVLDVTAGGGSIPFEAGRLGFRAIANELNPVACFILRATCQWPQQYGYALLDDYLEVSTRYQARVNELLTGVYPDEFAPDCANGNCPHPQRYHCTNDCDESPRCSHRKLGEPEHINVRAQRYAQTYLWARTVRCAACDVEIPLSPNWRLDNKGTGMRVEPNENRIGLHIVHDRRACSDCRAKNKGCHLAALYPDRSVSNGTVTRAIATCPACGSTTPKGYLAQEAQAGRMGHRLYCVIYRDSWRGKNKNGTERKRETTCRVFAEPQERHFASDAHVSNEMNRLQPKWDADDVLPAETVPTGNDQRPHTYGMEQWVKMFNPRQQLAHGYCVQAFRECVDADQHAGRLDDRRKAAWGYVALAFDKMINRNSLLTRWDGGANKVAGTFDSHDFGFKWSYSEMAVTCRGLGLEWSLSDIADCLSDMVGMTGYTKNTGQLVPNIVAAKTAPPAEVIQGDARDLPLDDNSVDCVIFDPPYEENVCYAELSDFFYVWLKRTAAYVFPDDFTDYLTEKDQEAISSPARFKNQAAKGKSAKTLAIQDYQQKMAEIFAECRRVIKPDGITTVMFNHKSTAAWDALTVALINAKFAITRTWPVKTEAESSIHIKGRAAARTTILLVCRPREENPFPKPWHEVEELIAQAVRDDIRDNLSQAALKPIDLYLSAFGPALRVISEHWGTERESANPDPDRINAPFAVTPTDALQVARREVSRHRAQEISREWASNPVDAGTKFYVLAKDATENDTLLFDEANLLARAIGVRLEKNDGAMKRIVSFKDDKVSLISARDRLAARNIGEDINPATTLDTVHTAIALTDRRNTLDAQQWLTQRLHDPQDGQFRATLEALIRTTKPGHDDHQAQRNLWQALYAAEPPQPAAAQPALL